MQQFIPFYDFFVNILPSSAKGQIIKINERITPDTSATYSGSNGSIPGWMLDPVTGRFNTYSDREYNPLAIQYWPHSNDAVQLRFNENKPVMYEANIPGGICPHAENRAHRLHSTGYQPTIEETYQNTGTKKWVSVWLNSIPRTTDKTSAYSEFPVRGS